MELTLDEMEARAREIVDDGKRATFMAKIWQIRKDLE